MAEISRVPYGKNTSLIVRKYLKNRAASGRPFVGDPVWLTRLGVHEQMRDQIIGHYSSNMGRRYAHIQRPDITATIDKLPWRGIDLNIATSGSAWRVA